MLKIKSLITLGTLVLLIAMTGGCTEAEHGKLERPQVKGVTVEPIMRQSAPLIYEVNGTIKAETVSTVSSRIMGEIRKIHVSEGSKIKKGQLLVTIDDRDMVQKVRAAQKGYEEAQSMLQSAMEQSKLADKTFGRLKELYNKNALSEQEYDQANTRQKVSTNELERARAMLKRAESSMEEAKLYMGYTKLLAPIDSVVIKKHVSSGSMAAPGTPLVTIEDSSAFKLEVNVDAKYHNDIKPGTSVEVEFPSLDEQCTAHVARVIPNINPATRTFTVEIKSGDSKPEGMRTGLYAKVSFEVGQDTLIMVPKDAIVRRGQLEGVFVVIDNNLVVYRLVRTGRAFNEMTEVVSGLNEGDRVITAGVDNAVDGGVIIIKE